MNNQNSIKLFEDKSVRAIWNDEQEKWYFSVVDIVAILTENDYQHARNHWKVLKLRLKEEGNKSVTNCYQLKMKSTDGKFYKTDVADTEQILRLIQSIPSKKAEPFKLWLAKVGKERIDETYDPEISKGTNPTGFEESKNTVIQGGTIAKIAKEQIENASGKKIVSSKNARELKNVDSQPLLNK